MNHELAKELKDAGYIQAGHGWYVTNKPSREENMRVLVGEEPKSEQAYIPTLEELIEACGDDAFSLSGIGHEWRAQHGVIASSYAEGKGSTPEIAVARLWLALNKKV